MFADDRLQSGDFGGLRGGLSIPPISIGPHEGPQMSITETAIRALKPRVKPYKVADEKGLYLLVTPSGAPPGRSPSARTSLPGTPRPSGNTADVIGRMVAKA